MDNDLEYTSPEHEKEQEIKIGMGNIQESEKNFNMDHQVVNNVDFLQNMKYDGSSDYKNRLNFEIADKHENKVFAEINETNDNGKFKHKNITVKEEMNSNVEEINCNVEEINCNVGEMNYNVEEWNEKKYSLRNRKQKSIPYDEKIDVVLKEKTNDVTEVDVDTIETIFACTDCNEQYYTNRGLLSHRKYCNKNTQKLKYTCLLCSETFETNEELVTHKKCHENEQCFFCKPCRLAFSDHFDYLMHKVIHARSDKMHCKECGRDFTTKTGFKIHITTHFDKRNEYECKVCNKFYKNEMCYTTHLKQHETLMECGECGKMSKSAEMFKYHMSTHTGVKPYQCLYCGKGFRSKCARKSHHLRYHTNDRPFKCEICPYKGKAQTDLKSHMATHSDNKFECDICQQVFTNKGYLVQHKRSHTQLNLLKCMECGKGFTNKTCLKSHVLHWHTEEKRFKCEVCESVAFKVIGDLRRHYRSRKHKNEAFAVMKMNNGSAESTA